MAPQKPYSEEIKMRNQKTLTEIIRNLLVRTPVQENEIQEGMNIFYATGQPSGQISLNMAKVVEVIEGRLRNGLRGFKGILPSGGFGTYRAILDHRLNVTDFYTNNTLTNVYDERKATSSLTEESVGYKDGILAFEWRNLHYYAEPIEGTYMIRGRDTGIVLVSKKDPKTIRLFTPGLKIQPDENTLSFVFERDKLWRIVQEIKDGPKGNFILPGYRIIHEEVYQSMQLV